MCSCSHSWCCQVCGQWVQQPTTCPVCQAINYCGQSHRKKHWRNCHSEECARMKQQVMRRHVSRCILSRGQILDLARSGLTVSSCTQVLSDFPFHFTQQTVQQVHMNCQPTMTAHPMPAGVCRWKQEKQHIASSYHPTDFTSEAYGKLIVFVIKDPVTQQNVMLPAASMTRKYRSVLAHPSKESQLPL